MKTCQALGDIGRTGEWTDAAVQWCQERGVDSWYPGLCRLHRCEVSSLRGEWGAAEREAVRAADELAPFGDYLTAEGEYLAGEIRRRRGDEADAEEAFRRAHRLGRDPQPGLALLRLAQGDAEVAVRQLRRAVSEELAASPGLAASTGAACHSGDHRPSSGLPALGLSRQQAAGAVRLSMGRWSTRETVAFAWAALVSAAEEPDTYPPRRPSPWQPAVPDAPARV